MSKMIQKGAIALAAAALFGAAFAQGNPPNPKITNPAIGAGSQSPQGTPMGQTGTMAAPSTSGSTMSSTTAAPMTDNSAMSSTASGDTSATTTTRKAKRDRG